MSAFKITENTWWVGALNPNLRVFDIVMSTDYGTTYNAYLIKGKDKTALIETVHDKYFDVYLDNIAEIADVSKIDYIILNHTEPDHSGSLYRLLEKNPNLTAVVSQAGAIYLKNITNRTDYNTMVVKDGDKLDLGGRELTFINAPFLHWPDSMFTYDPANKTIFTCDFFGAHYCEPYIMDTKIKFDTAYKRAFKGYYDAIFGPFPRYVAEGLKKTESLDLDYICVSHGPVITKDGVYKFVRDCYEQWCSPQQREKPTIPIFYTSAYGNTHALANEVMNGIKSRLPEYGVHTFDIIEHPMAELANAMAQSEAFLIGTPTINKDAPPPVWSLLGHVDAINMQKHPCAVFGSYGWSGEAIPAVTERLKTLKLAVFEENCKICFVPSENELKSAYEFGQRFADTLKK